METKNEILLFLFLALIMASLIYVLYVFTDQARIIDNLSFKEKSNDVLVQDVEVPEGWSILSRVLFGVEKAKLQEFVAIIASFILFLIFFISVLELTNLKGWQIALIAVILNLLAGFLQLVKIVGLAFFNLFNFLEDGFYQLIAAFFLSMVLMWLFSFIFAKVKQGIIKRKEARGEIRVKELKKEYRF